MFGNTRIILCVLTLAFPLLILGKPITVSSMTRPYPNSMPGKMLKIQKTWDATKGEARIVSDDGTILSGNDLFRLEEAELNAIRTKFGRLSDGLIGKWDKFGPNDSIQVVVTVKPPPGITYLSRFDHTPEELRKNSLAAANAKPPRSLPTVFSFNGITNGRVVSDYTGMVKLPKSQVMKLAFDDDVADVSEFIAPVPTTSSASFGSWMMPGLFSQGGNATENLVTLARSAYSHSQAPLPANLANQVRAATFESGLEASFVSCLGVSPAIVWDPYGTASLDYRSHSLHTFNCLVNAAPGARFYHRNSFSYANPASVSYILNNGINAASMSAAAADSSTANIDNMTIDDFSYRSPFTVFSTSAGNSGVDVIPDWAGSYNGISVGNVQDSNYTHFRIVPVCGAAPTTARNPNPRYGGCIDGGTFPNCRGDRELPYIVSPGWAPRLVASPPPACALSGSTTSYPIFMKGPCIPNNGSIYDDRLTHGTSMSAPTMSGMVTSLIGQVPTLYQDPTGIRAILLLTARNVTGGYWDWLVDGWDGAGVVHGLDAINFAKTMSWISSPNNVAKQNGYYASSFQQVDFSPSAPRQFNIQIPSVLPSGRHLRIVLTWTSSPDLINRVNDLSDLDLHFVGNSESRFASSWDSNIEILDILPSEVTPNGTYMCRIVPYTWRHHPNARSNRIYASLVWTWVTNHAH
jgi:hypothetical protein